ncbi:MAG TPA: undecaprenyl/decaprenyl-phosphate alpha-N-acetylglucosaminyl 1-phosphate transferase [Clostridiaceae bacterium]|nr:undecaprenyl/decaprenyl-phosphate alpha-N-acetylglucosaminyl 1-phosphate transferase [Clostridiaceae bacterium]
MYIEYLITFTLAFIVSFSATPIAKKLAFKIGAVDVPRDKRRMHKKPIARLGGTAIFMGFLVSVLFAVISIPNIFKANRELVGLLVGILIIEIMGILDDVKQLRARTKLMFQILAALAVVIIGDTRIESITNPFAPSGISTLSGYISYPLSVLWIVGITNAVNLIDGLDGLAAGVSSISSLSLFFISLLRTDIDINVVIYTSIITIALAGATLGFLPFNFNPAKIFMAESGAAFLGFTLSVISIQGTLKSYATISIAIPLLVLGVPLFDTIFAIFRRLINGRPIMEADRGHLHHRLIDMGLSHKQSVVMIYTVSAALGLCAIVLADRGILSAMILLVAVSVFIIGGAKFMSEVGSSNYVNSPIEAENSDNDIMNKGISVVESIPDKDSEISENSSDEYIDKNEEPEAFSKDIKNVQHP